MSAAEIDEYLNRLDEPKRSTLSRLRRDILAVVPDAEQCISYAVPGFKVVGNTIAGFARVQESLELPAAQRIGVSRAGRGAGRLPEVIGCSTLPVDQPLPAQLVRKLIAVRLSQA